MSVFCGLAQFFLLCPGGGLFYPCGHRYCGLIQLAPVALPCELGSLVVLRFTCGLTRP
jgi:hypothetical protein